MSTLNGMILMRNKRILFLTGTRADYGKLKSLIKSVEESDEFDCHIFVTGMHTLKDFGNTQSEIIKDGYKNIHVYMNQVIEEPMDLVLANTINGFGRYIRELQLDMIVIHGDRVEALAGAIVGALNNILVAHIEGGELSGTIDDSIRHSISKLAHIHFVSNKDAKRRLIQLGEDKKSIYVIGSPDIDLIKKSNDLSIEKIKKRYEIPFDNYGILIFHPVTTELDTLESKVNILVDSIIESEKNYIVIQPNNDMGHKIIKKAYRRFDGISNIKIYPSIRFEFFIELLRNANFIIGNSSAGIHEAPVMNIPTINVGSRQMNRYKGNTIRNIIIKKGNILNAIKSIKKVEVEKNIMKNDYFGQGDSSNNFMKILYSDEVWNISCQKKFYELPF